MGFRVHVRVDPDADRCPAAHVHRNFVEHCEFGFALDIEAADSSLQRLAHFRTRFANARKNDFPHIATGGHHAGEFATRDNVKAAACLGKHPQHAKRGVGFHGIANLRIAPDEPPLIGRQCAEHGRLGVDEQRGSVRVRQGL